MSFGLRRTQALAAGAAALVVVALTAAYGLGLDRSLFDAPPERLPVTLAVTTNEESALIWFAEDLGFFDEVGLDVTIAEYEFGRLAAEGMLAGDADVATAAEFVVVRNSFVRDDLRVIGSVLEAQLMHVVARTDLGIEAVGDLAGKRIGFPRGTQGEFFLDRFLAFAGIAASAVEFVDLPPSRMIEELAGGGVDAIAIWDPVAYGARERLGGDAVVFPGLSDDSFHFLLVTTEAWIAANPEAAERLFRAVLMAEEFNEASPEQAAAILRRRFDLDADYLAYSRERRRLAATMPQSLVSNLELQARWAIERDLVQGDRLPDYLEILDPGALSAVDPVSVTLIR